MLDGPQEIALPSGGTVVLRDVKSFRAGDKIDVASWVKERDDRVVRHFQTQAAMARVCVLSWTLPYEPDAPIPADDPAVVRKLTPEDYDVLMDAIDPILAVLFPPDVTPDDAETHGSPTGPASG